MIAKQMDANTDTEPLMSTVDAVDVRKDVDVTKYAAAAPIIAAVAVIASECCEEDA